ncbi:ornithine cyclodeaminase family protein [Rubritalea spongiae]|uniref:Ornithine cyclodeaminase family protein n=1 Tax=Rubritalea spongiae TaxID=430797 RepID=A0ABW5E2S2_9BACT
MTTQHSIPYLSEQELSALDISTEDAICSIETLIANVENKTAWSAPKTVIMPDDGRYMMAALAATDEPSLLAVKTLVLNPHNPERGLPQINGLVTMLDSQSGLPVALLDGNWITAVRTAALSATAAKHMARKDASVIAFVGCGVQAKSHLHAFTELFPIKEVRMFGRGQANIDKLCQDAKKQALPTVICKTAKEAVSSADIVISSVTYSPTLTPFLDANWLKPGSFSAITDLAAPWEKESFAAFNQVVIDDLEQEAVQPNKLASSELITGDLSELVLRKCSGRKCDNDRNAFIFRGLAIGDLALTALAYQKYSLEKS